MDKSPGKKYKMPKLIEWQVRNKKAAAAQKPGNVPKLGELIDLSVLQHIQDWAAKTANVTILIRDAEGFPVTKPSMSSRFCNLLAGPDHLNSKCRESNLFYQIN